jgi:hypothetical protein
MGFKISVTSLLLAAFLIASVCGLHNFSIFGQFLQKPETNTSGINSTNTQQNLTSTETKNSKLAEVVLLSQKLKKESGGYRDLIGQVKNIGNDTALVVVIRLAVYDKDGNVIGSGYNFADIDTLKPAQKSTFTIMSDAGNFKGMKYYEIALEWSNMDNSKGYVDNAKIYKENNTKSID